MKSEKTNALLNDLIEINNDRVVGYEKAKKETKTEDADLRALFDHLAENSKWFGQELSKQVAASGDTPATGTTEKGKLYRVWMDLKVTFGGHDRKTILASCEFGEDAAQKAYDEVLSDPEDLSPELVQLIKDQKDRLKESHDRIKKMRDEQPA